MRQPRQRRAQVTVDAVLDSVARLLEKGARDGAADPGRAGPRGRFGAVTTNRIAEVAGVSIGSVYQYFPNKQAIYDALLERHLERMEQLIDDKLRAPSSATLADRVRGLVEGMVAAHAMDPELHELLLTELPHRTDPVRQERVRAAYRFALEPRARPGEKPRDVERVLYVVTLMVEALVHGAVFGRPARLSVAAVTEEAVRAVLAYLEA